MRRSAPLLTLVAVAVLGGALLLANTLSNPAADEAVSAAPAAAPSAAPTTEPAPPTTEAPAVTEVVYAGRSSGNEVTVAIAVRGGRAVAYVCDGETVEAWLEGTLEGDQLSLGGADGTTVTGTATDGDALGTVAVDGKQWPYAAKAVDAPAGLYEGRADVGGVANRIGWIQLDDGTQVGIVSVDGGQDPEPAPPLDPEDPDVQIGGVPVEVSEIDGDDPVVLR